MNPSIELANVLSSQAVDLLYPDHLKLIPQANERYEFELAYYESKLLSDDLLVRNSGYFAKVGECYTRHFLMCQGEPVKVPKYASEKLKAFFDRNIFRTGYATHGLFPYRGKFHPQMIKGLLNAMGLKPRDKVLDPMMGSGTVLIEAALMGIESVGIDCSPFCRFMTQAKIDALTVPIAPIKDMVQNSTSIFKQFACLSNSFHPPASIAVDIEHAFSSIGDIADLSAIAKRREFADPRVFNFILLAFLDAIGYSQRSNKRKPEDHFKDILLRYIFVADKIQHALIGSEHELAPAYALEGDARKLPMEDDSIDGIIFSPPYSFAIDYLQNDAFHLQFLGVNLSDLKERMIGLRGSSRREQYNRYLEDMNLVIKECSRVLKPGKICTIIVGTNNNQLSRILDISSVDVKGINRILTELAQAHNLVLIRQMERTIKGMANTMRSEYIVMLQHI